MNYELKDISVVIPSYNNLEYLKLAYQSIRDISDDIEVILYGDGCDDGTDEWLLRIKHKNTITHSYSERIGHTLLYDYGFQTASRKVIGILHADMVVHKNFFENILKYMGPNTIVCGTNVEPPLHPPGGEKHIFDAGMYPDKFSVDAFNSFCDNLDIDKTQSGIFAPWFLLKDEYFDKIGGHDPIYAPYGYEDSDIFSRMALAGFDFIQSRDALVYHFTQRGHKWTKGVGIENDGYRDQMEKTRKIYIRKFGTEPIFDYNHKPIPTAKYNIGLIIYNAPMDLVIFLEPYFTTIYTNNLGKVDGVSKIKTIDDDLTNDIFVTLNAEKLTNENIGFLLQLPHILKQSGEIGNMEYDIFKLHIKSLTEYQNDLIKVN
jgi:glycosyltransferase involved in cell wall biosynthesis